MRPTAFDEASRQTYGRLYWTLTALLVLATIAAWIWGTDGVRFTVGAVSMVYIIVVGVLNHRRMNRIVRERERERERGRKWAAAYDPDYDQDSEDS